MDGMFLNVLQILFISKNLHTCLIFSFMQNWKDNYITEEDLDDAIEEALNTRVDYNFALQPDGSKITPESKKAAQSET